MNRSAALLTRKPKICRNCIRVRLIAARLIVHCVRRRLTDELAKRRQATELTIGEQMPVLRHPVVLNAEARVRWSASRFQERNVVGSYATDSLFVLTVGAR